MMLMTYASNLIIVFLALELLSIPLYILLVLLACILDQKKPP
jgi:NADH:ubiquinone oxidoreductase subunit 2 (subunit N)